MPSWAPAIRTIELIDKPEDAAGHSIGAQTGTVQEGWIQDTLVAAGLTPPTRSSPTSAPTRAAWTCKNGRIELLLIDAEPAIALAEQTWA